MHVRNRVEPPARAALAVGQAFQPDGQTRRATFDGQDRKPDVWHVAATGVLTFVAITAAFLAVSPAFAEDPIAWLTGDKLRAQLEQKVDATWEGNPFRRAITNLSRSQCVAILLDRRVDPDEKIDISFNDVTLEAAIKLIAGKKQIGFAKVGPVIYLGPTATAEKLRTLSALRREEALRLPAVARTRILQQQPMRWDDLAAPRELLKKLSADAHIPIGGTERIPHDLWAAADLPAASFVDRLTLIAGQFDLTFSFADDGSSVRLDEMPDKVVIQHSYPLRSAAGRGKEIAQRLAESLPGALIDVAGDKLVVRGRAEDQDFVEAFLSGRPAKQTSVTPGQKVYQLSVVKPVGALLKALGPKLDLDIRVDEEAIKAAGLSLTTEVKVDVKNVTADELLAAVLSPAKLTFDRQGKVIEVKPANR
jgi:hypothetical protein